VYLRLDEGYDTHRKTMALCRLLKNSEAGIFPIRLWTWACRSSPTGDLTGADVADLERIMRWRGRSGNLFAALVAAGFIDQERDRTVLHDWAEWTGADIEGMEADARRRRYARRHASGQCGGTVEKCPICARTNSVTAGQSAANPRTAGVVQTRPDQTRQDKTRSEKTGGEEDLSSSGVAAEPPAPASPALLVFPTVRGRSSGPTEWHYTEAVEAELREYFPALDVRSAVRGALGWVKAREANRKTAGGMMRFLTGWLQRAQNRGEGRDRPNGSALGGARGGGAREREARNAEAAAVWLERGGGRAEGA
jgi:hypothetical protein